MRKLIKYLVVIVTIILVSFIVYNNQFAPGFDMSSLDPEHIYHHIEALSSPSLEGKLVGSTGNEEALNYIKSSFEEIGLEPGNSDGSYFQNFETIVANIDQNPEFTISNSEGNILESFEMYKDYSVMSSNQGGSVDYQGEILIVGSNLLRIPKEEIKNKIVIIVSGTLNPDRIQYVIDHGGLGIFCSTDTDSFSRLRALELQKRVSMEDKSGETILAGYISKSVYNSLVNLSTETQDRYIVGRIENARVKVDMDFSIVETANVIGKIQGNSQNGRVLLLSANIDGLGLGTKGQDFPGALTSSSGISSLIEIARVIKNQEITCGDTIVFIGWNGQQQEFAGSKYYVKNPIYPFDKSTLIHIESIGSESVDGFKVSGDRFNSNILSNKFLQYGFDHQVNLGVEQQRLGVINGFIDESVPALNLNDGNKWLNTYGDNIDNIQLNILENRATGVLSFIKREIYNDFKIDFLNLKEVIIIILLIGILIINSTTQYFNKRYPNKKFLSLTNEEIYYSFPVRLIRGFSKTVLPYLVILFMIVLLANLSSQTNIKKVNGQWVTNFSPYLLLKKTIFYLRNLFDPQVHLSYTVGNIFEVIKDSSSKSLKLLISALSLSLVFGIAKGLLDGMKVKKNKINSLGTLVVFSIPDVLIVLVGLLFYVYIAVNYPWLNDKLELQKFILPLITLTIIPSIYISRITFITTQSELDKDYIKHARAIGMSKFRVFTTELFPAVLFTIVDTLPGIMAMLFTNMIIVEHLFNYNGISYYLLYLYNRNDAYRFVPLALTLGFIYIIFTYGISWIAKLINPLKREVKSK